MKLSELHTGEIGVIVKVAGQGSFRKRIVEMGFIKGKEVKVVLNAPLQDPVEYEVMGYKVSLRRAEAELVEVMTEADALASLSQQDNNLKALELNDMDKAELSDTLQRKIEKLAEEKSRTIYVALVGNPNCGKTSLFNIASGAHEHVGNYSGVTVGAKNGYFNFKAASGQLYHIRLVDLPGTYSLSAYSPEEVYVRKQLIEEAPDVVLNVIDSSNLERNLYLTTQLIDMHLRLVCALNMYDELRKRKDQLDHKMLGTLLGCPFVPTVCRTGEGVNDLFETIVRVYENNGKDETLERHIHVNHGKNLEKSINLLKQAFQKNKDIRYKYSTRYLSIKFMETDKEVEKIVDQLPNHDELVSIRYNETKRIKEELAETPESALIDAKYAFIQGALKEVYHPGTEQPKKTLTDKIDRVVTHKWLGYPIFFLILGLIFEATFAIGQYPMDWIDSLIKMLSDFIAFNMAPGSLKDLIVDGILSGVGAVIVFLPNILILYFFISLLEDSGYMARAAFIMDRLMHHMGLHGKSFIPMIMGFGCNVPAVMSTRTIENPKSRLITMLVIPMMSCSARIPIYVLLLGTFFPKYAGLMMLGLYALGMLMAVVMAKLFSRMMTKKIDLPFVMELPPYRIPMGKSIFRHTWEKGKQYIYKMGHIILVACIIIWALNYFPRPAEPTGQGAPQEQTTSYLERVGRFMEPVTRPLGFDWKMNVGILAGTSAKELVVSTLGVLYADEKAEDIQGNEDTVAQDKNFQSIIRQSMSPAAAVSYLIFILLYFPCIATVAAIKGESGKWKWALFTTFYTTGLAYVLSLMAYQFLRWWL